MSNRIRFPKKSYPFSDNLCIFMDFHPEFLNSLKLNKINRFEFIPVIGLTRLPPGEPFENDQIIGLFYLDKNNFLRSKTPLFKQDFIVNINHLDNEFVSYSVSQDDGLYVRPLKDFFDKYGKNGTFYHRAGSKPWHHHYNNLGDLPDYPGLREAAEDIIKNL